MKLALLTNFEILGSPQVARFNRLSLELEERGTRLLLLTTNVHPELQALYLQIPYALREFLHIGVEPAAVSGEDALVENEARWIRDCESGQARQGARCCRAFYEQLLGVLEPDVVLPWNTLFPHSRILQLLCEERDTPVFTIERGALPDTLMLDRLRNNVESELNNSAPLASIAASYTPRPELLAQYRRYYHERRPHKYALGSEQGRLEQRQQLAQLTSPLVLALGQAHGAGIYPRESRSARRNFAHFPSIHDALERLVESAPPTWQVAFRDHPLNRGDDREPPLPPGVLRLDEGPLGDVLPFAELVVTFGSTTALYEALLLDKPLVVVGDTPIGRFEPYVRCSDGDLAAAIQRALDPALRPAQQERADAALGFLLEHALFAERPDVPVRRGIPELAAFIASFDGDCPIPLQMRFRRFQAWVGG